MGKKDVIKIDKLEKGETFIKVTSPFLNAMSSDANESPYDRVRWCIKAIGNDDHRPALNCLFIDDTYMAATDGRRLHLTWNEYGYSPGLYHVLFCNGKQILLERDAQLGTKDYPDFHRVLPYSGCANGIAPLTLSDPDRKVRLSRLLHHVYTGTGKCYNLGYLEDAFVPDTEHHFQTHGKGTLVIACEDFNRIAMVMPFSV